MLCSSGSAMVQPLFKDLCTWKTCLVYIDDIIVVGKSFGEPLCNLRAVLEHLWTARLTLQPRKCQLLQTRVTYLGHVVSAQGIAPDAEKTRRLNQWPTPQSPKEVQQFLGLANYYWRFIKDFASLATPLHRSTEKGNQFKLTKESEVAFNILKNKLTSAPILALLNWSKPLPMLVTQVLVLYSPKCKMVGGNV